MPPPVIAARSVPASPRPSGTAVSAGASSLHALEQYLHNELTALPRKAPHRMVAIRHVFSEIIASLPAHGPLLSEVKQEYERALADAEAAGYAAALPRVRPAAELLPAHADAATAAVPSLPPAPESIPAHMLRPIHPLKLPASYYEAQWRRTQAELSLVKTQRRRLRRLVRHLRWGCVEAVQRTHGAGMPLPPSGDDRLAVRQAAVLQAATAAAAADANSDGFEEAMEDAPTGSTEDADRAIAASQAIVSEEMEAMIEGELALLREQLAMLETRVTAAGQVVQRTARASEAARIMVEGLLEDALSAGSYPTVTAAERLPPRSRPRSGTQAASGLGALLKMMAGLDAQLNDASRLLEPGWDARKQLDQLVATLV